MARLTGVLQMLSGINAALMRIQNRDEVLKETWPLELSGAWARMVLPCAKVTWPVGVPVAGGTAVNVAVKVTDWPLLDGLGVEVTAVDDAPV